MMRKVQESIPTIVSQQIAKAMTARKYANTRRLQTPRAYRMRRVISEDEEEDHQEQFPLQNNNNLQIQHGETN